MFSDVHTDFILNPLTKVLADGINACTSLSEGIENSALGEYFMQSLFLRMTGAQEQKLKCICWVMATNDYRYRYDLLNVKQYGECSEYKQKRGIYSDLNGLIQGFDSGFTPLKILDGVALKDGREDEIRINWEKRVDIKRNKQVADIIAREEFKIGHALTDEAKEKNHKNICGKPYPHKDLDALIYKEKKSLFVNDVVFRIIEMLDHSPLSVWNYREFLFFKEHWQDVLNSKHLNLTDNELLDSRLQGYYKELVFEHRNRTAHNTCSYQKDIPTLNSLADKGYVYNNYFFRIVILILIDEVFMLMFKKYRDLGINLL